MYRFLLLPVLLAATLGFALPHAQGQELQPLGIAFEGYEYPFPVAYYPVPSNGNALQMAYMDVQPEQSKGRSVVLLHGKNFCGAYWEETATDLAKAGYRVIIPDQLGFGKSSKSTDYPYSFPALATNTKSLLDTLGIEKATILGHSMGGMLAARFALMFPGQTEKLVLVNPIGLEDWQAKGVPHRSVDEWYARELKQNFESIKKYQLASYYDGRWDTKYDPWVELLARVTLSPEYPRLARVQALTYDMIYTQPVVHEFSRIQAPTLLIIGERDRTALGKDMVDEAARAELGRYDRLGKEVAETIPNATLAAIEGIGHLPHIEAYDKFIAPLMEFLAE
jgi:pimeloyl-ACP methyl ester carboxylesterase